MKILTIVAFTFSVLAACSKTRMDNTNTVTTPPPAPVVAKVDSISYLALGDSYTIGESVPEQQAFPYQLVSQLKSNGYPNAVPPVIIARTGWTTDELIAAIKQANITRKFDYVTLLIGVNNQYRGYSQTIYRTEFVQLLNTAIAYANGNPKHVFVISIPDWGVTPYANGQDRTAIGKQIDQFNTINREESLKTGVNYTDITPVSRQAANDATLVAGDGLHPSGKMYGLWVQQLVEPVATSLK